jgi:hypothetical protein
MTVYSIEKHRQHCQATSFMSELDDVNFRVTVRSELYTFLLKTQKYTATIHKQEFIVSRAKSGPTASWFLNTSTATFNSNLIRSSLRTRSKKKVSDHKVTSHAEISNHWHCNWPTYKNVSLRTLLAFLWTSTLHGRTWRVLEMILAVW